MKKVEWLIYLLPVGVLIYTIGLIIGFFVDVAYIVCFIGFIMMCTGGIVLGLAFIMENRNITKG